MAACRDGSASTANTISADVLIVVVALTVSSVMVAGLRFNFVRLYAAGVSSPDGLVRPSHGWRSPPRGEKRGDRLLATPSPPGPAPTGRPFATCSRACTRRG